MFARMPVLFVFIVLSPALGSCKQRSFDLSLGRTQSLHDAVTLDCSQSQVLESNEHGEMGLRVQAFEGGGPYTIRSIKAYATGLNHRELIHDEGSDSYFEKGRELFRQCYQPALDLVFELYKTRRGWNDEFIDKLRGVAKQYELASEYILVLEKSQDGTSNLVGTIRFISIPYIAYTHRVGGVVDGPRQVTTDTKVFTAWDLLSLGNQDLKSFVMSEDQHSKVLDRDRLKSLIAVLKDGQVSGQQVLPLESIGFKLDFGVGDTRCQSYDMTEIKTAHHCLSAGEVIEPGNLGVLKESNREILTIFVRAILLRMMRDDLSLPSVIANRTMYTYNDKTLLYTRLGFVESAPALEKFGINWTLLEANMSRFLGHYRRNLQAMSIQGGNESLATVQTTIDGLGWQKNLQDRMENAKHGDHLKFLQDLYSSLQSSQGQQTGLQEVCGMVSIDDIPIKTVSGQVLQVEKWSLRELFSNEAYEVEFGDGATVNHLALHWEKGVPVCVTAFVEPGKPLSVLSVNFQRTW